MRKRTRSYILPLIYVRYPPEPVWFRAAVSLVVVIIVVDLAVYEVTDVTVL